MWTGLKMNTGSCPVLILLLFAVINCAVGWVDIEDNRDDKSLYNIGIGIGDATGPSAGVNMMGYANLAQIAKGIHLRLYSRAFIFDDGIRRLVFVSVDSGMIGQLTKKRVVTRLTELFGSTYTFHNVIISGTHTHAGPAGFLQHLLFDITSLGFIPETLDAMVDGIVESIQNAHNSMVQGRVYVSRGDLLSASINRSPTAYDNNPEEERLQYEHNTDKSMTLLKIVDIDGNDLGMVNWFAVHPTSMNSTNVLISGDNKGYASQLFETHLNPAALPGKGKFVAAFAQSNCGDVSPNTKGARCLDTGLPCDLDTSTCDGKVHLCVASGPGNNMVESTQIIGQLQYDRALELYNSETSVLLSGSVQYSEQLVYMANYTVTLPSGEAVDLCKPALGYSFAAGTTDGAGTLTFFQGMTESIPFWDTIVDGIFTPTPIEQIACHAPKPILLNTGDFNWPYPWHPSIMDTQIGRVGQFFINAVPGEFTSMAGRRMKKQISEFAASKGIVEPISVLSGYSNGYSHYITTPEEYMIQRYEGASTIFGPNTLTAYLQQYTFLLEKMSQDEQPEVTEEPEDLTDKLISLLPKVFYDTAEAGYEFGQVIAEPYPIAYIGETVIAKFATGHPRNDLMRGDTYLAIEKKISDTTWELVATDASWETRFEWRSIALFLGTSEATINWDIPETTEEGIYRISHYGAYKTIFTGVINKFEGTTSEFKVILNTNSILPEKRIRLPPKKESFNWIKYIFSPY